MTEKSAWSEIADKDKSVWKSIDQSNKVLKKSIKESYDDDLNRLRRKMKGGIKFNK